MPAQGVGSATPASRKRTTRGPTHLSQLGESAVVEVSNGSQELVSVQTF